MHFSIQEMPPWGQTRHHLFEIVVRHELHKLFDLMLTLVSGCFHSVNHSISRFATLNEDWVLIRCQIIYFWLRVN